MSEDPELRWRREVWAGHVTQLTPRAVVAGMAIGAALALSNLYVVLKTGWSLGVTLTSCIAAFGVFRALSAAGLTRGLTVLENNAVGSVASAAAFMTGGGNMAALPALLLLTGARPSGAAMVAWFAVIAALGVFAAIPIKRQIINREQLPFPSAVATAETVRAMHGGGRSAGAARWLFGAAGVAALLTLWRDVKALPFRLPGLVPFPFSLGGHAAREWSLGLDVSLVLVGGGALMPLRTGLSMALGALVTWGVFAPALVRAGVAGAVDYKALVQLTLWPGAALLVSSGLTSFAFQWRSVARTAADLVALARRRSERSDDPLADIEAPPWWFPAGFLALSPVAVVLMAVLFDVPWWAGVASIPLAFFMGVVAARVTGETDITPTKALGPVTQLIAGVALPANVTANVMSANLTGGVGLHAADLLTDLKSGYLLGASPRQQVAAQLFGVAAGALVVVPAFTLLVPTAAALGTPELPAPAVLVWASVSRALSEGLAGLPPVAQRAMAVAAALGVGLAALERLLPKRARAFVPSATALGITMVMPASMALAMFVGSVLAALTRRLRPEFAHTSLTPLASGLVAGESLAGITLILLAHIGSMATS